METDKTLAQDILQMLATGLLRHVGILAKPNLLITLPDEALRRGWEKLCFYLVSRGYPFPQSIGTLVEWCHLPVSTWEGVGSIYVDLGYTTALLQDGQPTDLCETLGADFINSRLIEQELQDQNFVALFELCQRLNLPDQYTKAREFLLRHSIVIDPLESFASDSTWIPEVLKTLKACYEPIPISAKRGTNKEKVYLCPHCGWTLQWRKDDSFCHQGGVCAELYGELSKDAISVTVQPHSLRTKEGIQRFVVAPEVALLQLYDKLSKEWGVRCELFPQLDSYDLLIVFSTGKRWAVDLKDHKHPKSLALGLNDKPFRYTPSWKHAFYIFPDHRAKPEYMRTFSNYWQLQKDVSYMGVRELVALVRKEMG